MKSKTQITTSTFGAVMGIAGLEHGIGEIAQGNVAPQGVFILSWPDAEFFRIVAGEPALTIIPNLLISGILTVLISLAYIYWAVRMSHRKHSGREMILLAVLLLPVGGGLFPPVLGMLVGLVATRIHSSFNWWRNHLSTGVRSFLARGWAWSYAICLGAWIGIFPGLNILSVLFRVENESLTIFFILLAISSLFVTVLCGFAYDSQEQVRLD